jgi:DNA polymerase III delta prime subunit
MFENIIGQPSIVETLRQELSQHSFPSAALFHGSPFAGKLSTALEAARVLTCSREGGWSCSCASCRKHRLLVHPNILLLGWRYFGLEIAAAADVLRRTRRLSAQYLFVRAVRKLTRRFDPILWEGEEAKIRPVGSALAEIEEQLDALEPGGPGRQEASGNGLERRLERVVGLAQSLAKPISAENVPINQLRRASSWLHMTALAGKEGPSEAAAGKIMILENAERMHDSSSNYMLKLLEEPPQGSRLILITTRRSAMTPTVVSRLRPYLFVERGPEQQAEVLRRVFHEDSGEYRNLRQYFLYWNDVNPAQLQNLARRFIQAVLDKEGQMPEELEENIRSRSARGFVSSFLEEILGQLLVLLRGEALSPFLLKRWNQAIRRHQQAFVTFNQQPSLTVESLYYNLRTIQ